MLSKNLYGIFRQGSKTYFYSSLFFPREVKEEVFALYAFVRQADDLVDAVPQKGEEFAKFRKGYESAMRGRQSGVESIDKFVELSKRKGFEPKWTEAFLDAMESDLHPPKYRTIEDSIRYMHGSAEVVGLYMCKIMNVEGSAHHAARMLGRAMQYANFIRDIDEDVKMGRNYFPEDEMRKFGLRSLKFEETSKKPEEFGGFVRAQIAHYRAWQEEGEKGFCSLPSMVQAPVKTASEMYKWTLAQIEKDPFIVYRKKVKPSVARIIAEVGKNYVLCGRKGCATPRAVQGKMASGGGAGA